MYSSKSSGPQIIKVLDVCLIAYQILNDIYPNLIIDYQNQQLKLKMPYLDFELCN